MKKKTLAPYYLLAPAVFAFFVLSFSLHPQSPLLTHQFFDPDDYMQLNEVINWLQSAHPFGAGWFDLSHPRLSPGEHVIVHWARLVDLPIALFMLPFIPTLGMQNAALIASFIVPPLLFPLLMILALAQARMLVGKRRASLAAVMLLFVPNVLFQYLPSRVDHHGYEIIIAAFGLLCLTRIVLCPRGWRAAVAAAIAFACGVWIGTEALPWLILFTGCLAMLASWRGGFVLRNAAVFGIALPLAVAVVMLIALRPEEYTSRSLSWFSGADLDFRIARRCCPCLRLDWRTPN
jgi:asparagine N-glycosylation enzyme membrane subunit Stt3